MGLTHNNQNNPVVLTQEGVGKNHHTGPNRPRSLNKRTIHLQDITHFNFQVYATAMGTELSWNYSSTDHTGFSLLTNTSTEYTDVGESLKWTSTEIATLIQIIIRPILFLVGTTGNCLTFYIMRRTSLNDVSSCFYMSVLALADTSKSCSYCKTILDIFP